MWDLAGRLTGQPGWQLLGGYRRSIAAQASTVTFASIDEYLDVATQCLELGYPAIKLHAWGDARADAQLCLALREHVGAGVELAYDGSAGFDLADAIYLGHALHDAGYLWYEEPIREFSVTAYKWLADRVRVPLLVGETSDGAHMNTGDFIASGAATFVRTSAELRGGITGAMRIAHLADSFRLRAEVHGPGIYSQHLCMAIPNTTYYESLVTSTRVVREPVVGLPTGSSTRRPGPASACRPDPTTRRSSSTWSSTQPLLPHEKEERDDPHFPEVGRRRTGAAPCRGGLRRRRRRRRQRRRRRNV